MFPIYPSEAVKKALNSSYQNPYLSLIPTAPIGSRSDESKAILQKALTSDGEVLLLRTILQVPNTFLNNPPMASIIYTHLNNSMQESHSVQQHRPARMVGVVQGVLGDVSVGSFQAGPDALRRLVSELEGHLKYTIVN